MPIDRTALPGPREDDGRIIPVAVQGLRAIPEFGRTLGSPHHEDYAHDEPGYPALLVWNDRNGSVMLFVGPTGAMVCYVGQHPARALVAQYCRTHGIRESEVGGFRGGQDRGA